MNTINNMKNKKGNPIIGFRVKPEVKDILEKIGAREARPIGNVVFKIFMDHVKENPKEYPELHILFTNS